MDIHIHTQYAENYGDAASPYWKFKGGSTIVVTGFNHPLSSGIGEAAEAIVNGLRPTIDQRDEYSETYIIDWELVPAGTRTEDEVLQLKYDGKITFPSKRVAV